MLRWFALFALFAPPLYADVSEAVEDHILPGYATFADAAAALNAAAEADCTALSLQPAYNAAFDAWLGVSHLRLGPAEQDGRALAIQFWPDPKSAGAKAQSAMIRAKDPAVHNPAAFAEVSVAARGLMSLERLLYPTELPADAQYACDLTRATTADLARIAAAIRSEWQTDYAKALLSAGGTGNTLFLNPAEARQALYTALIAGFEFVEEQRIGRPLGTFERPRPERAEASASGRSVRNINLSLKALQQMAIALAPDSPVTDAAFARAFAAAEKLKDPILGDAATPQGWLKLQILQQDVLAIRDAAETEVGTALQVGIGFNAGDGD